MAIPSPTRLKEIGYVTDSAVAFVTNSSGEKTYVHNILMYNTDTSEITITLYNVPDSSGSVGTASSANEFFSFSLGSKQLYVLTIPGEGIVLEDTNDTLQCVASVTGKVTVQAYGSTEGNL